MPIPTPRAEVAVLEPLPRPGQYVDLQGVPMDILTAMSAHATSNLAVAPGQVPAQVHLHFHLHQAPAAAPPVLEPEPEPAPPTFAYADQRAIERRTRSDSRKENISACMAPFVTAAVFGAVWWFKESLVLAMKVGAGTALICLVICGLLALGGRAAGCPGVHCPGC